MKHLPLLQKQKKNLHFQDNVINKDKLSIYVNLINSRRFEGIVAFAYQVPFSFLLSLFYAKKAHESVLEEEKMSLLFNSFRQLNLEMVLVVKINRRENILRGCNELPTIQETLIQIQYIHICFLLLCGDFIPAKITVSCAS